MKKIIASILTLFAFTSIFAEKDKTAQEVAEIFADPGVRVPDNCYGTLSIDNISPSGDVTEHMVVNAYGGVRGTDLKTLVIEFKAPADKKNMRVLQSQRKGKNDDRWVYMPSLRTTRRIPMSERDKSFAGEYTYNDMTIREPWEDKNEMLDTKASVTINGKTYTCYKISSTPIKKSEVEYGHRITWFDRETYLPVRIEYYDKKNSTKMTKIYEITQVEVVKGKTGISYPLRRENILTNLETNRKTRIRVESFVFDEPISSSYFTQSWLQTGKVKR